MTTISIPGFSGLAPRQGPSQLGTTQAQLASNIKLMSGELRSWRNAVATFTPHQSNILSTYKLVGSGSNYAWLEWTNVVDVAAGPVADPPPGSSTFDARIYYTDGVTPRKTNWNLATSNGTYTTTNNTVTKPVAWYNMGVAAPTGAVTATPSGGSGSPTVTTTYVYTYVSQFGQLIEESAPSPASALVTKNPSGATVALSGWATAQHTVNDNIIGIRIYRTLVGATTATYTYIDQIPVTASTGLVVSGGTSTGGVVLSGTTYNDTIADSSLGAAATLVSTFYTPPPATLQGIVSMPNGMLAGFTGNQVWFCEPYQPHAWPSTYMLTTEYPIVGLGVYGNSLVVTTTLNPYLITGNSPSAMTQERLPMKQPCASKASIAYDQFGVMYASPNGLVAIGPGIQDIISEQLYTRDEWQAINPTSMIGMLYNTFYMGFYTIVGTPNVYSGIVFARGDQPPLANFSFPVAGLFLDRGTGAVFAINVNDGKVYQLDADTVNNTTYSWQSKRFYVPENTAFAAFRVQADYVYMNNTAAYQAAYNAVVTANNTAFTGSSGKSLQGDINAELQTLPGGATGPYGIDVNDQQMNGSILQPLPTMADNRFVTVIFHGDDNVVFTQGVTTDTTYRMPALDAFHAWEIQITGNVPVRAFSMATTMQELKTV